MKQKAIFIVQNYIRELGEPYKSLRRAHFRQKSHSIWAAEEILTRILTSGKDPISVVEDFARSTDQYSCIDGSASYMFSVAHDTAMDILDRILGII